MSAADPIRTLQEAIYHRLSSDAWMADVPVLLARKGLADSDVEVALGTINEVSGKCGVVAIVLMPEMEGDGTNAPGPLFDLAPAVQVIETPLFNEGTTGVGKSCEAIALRAAQVLHFFGHGAGGVLSFVSAAPMEVAEGSISYLVRFRLGSGVRELAKVARPSIAATSAVIPATVTLACGTSGAAIRYTTDGSAPAASNEKAVLYATPFTVTAAASLRVGASATGYQASDVVPLEITAA